MQAARYVIVKQDFGRLSVYRRILSINTCTIVVFALQ